MAPGAEPRRGSHNLAPEENLKSRQTLCAIYTIPEFKAAYIIVLLVIWL